MMQYSTIEEAILALTQKYGTDVFENTPRFIALLSDYAPNHAEEQRNIRAFARAGGLAQIAGCIRRNDTYAALLAAICEKAVQTSAEEECQDRVVEAGKRIAAAIGGNDFGCVDPASVYTEGLKFFRRFPKDINMPVAVLLFKEAWSFGCTDALLYLSGAYLKGRGVSKNAAKGMQYLELAAEHGSIRAGVEYAEHLWKGADTGKDVSRAVEILKKLDDGNAFFMLGEIFREHAEYEKAFEAYLKGAERKHVYAQYAAALALATGQGVKRNMQEAKKWLRAAAVLGHDEARCKLEALGEKWD